ncbi:RING-7 protein [Microsporum canis CBS 113480]|uniref:RING-7 protein n=1 Tax=Arthroderma otae (strain ATCC MYA-4605 / CBS 113480) TaxID=554155 RepID=C5FQ01_ARTOC|nr:RING-7 protein [Microsporum canis CBS 113480]EEQ31954.1 RING-7 protein [Microsporum canis CBS 113480]
MASLWRLLALGLSLGLAAAQSIKPIDSRGSLQVGSPLYSLNLSPEPLPGRKDLHLFPSTPDLYVLDQSIKMFFQELHISGRLVTVSPRNANKLKAGDIAYLSCDPDDYPAQSMQENPQPPRPHGGDPKNNGVETTRNTAMIILYAVTGIITILFLAVILTGAIRAHRHPDRYGPRNIPGRARQSRAKGIARAVLDTLPIVKFGEDRERPKQHDVELADGQIRELDHEHAPAQAHTPAVESSDPSADADVPVTATTDASEQHQPRAASPSASAAGSAAGSAASEREPSTTCPICTDEFVRGQDVRLLPCNHSFHPECVDPWLVDVSGTCPLWYVFESSVSYASMLTKAVESISTRKMSKSGNTLKPSPVSKEILTLMAESAVLPTRWLAAHLPKLRAKALRLTVQTKAPHIFSTLVSSDHDRQTPMRDDAIVFRRGSLNGSAFALDHMARLTGATVLDLLFGLVSSHIFPFVYRRPGVQCGRY